MSGLDRFYFISLGNTCTYINVIACLIIGNTYVKIKIVKVFSQVALQKLLMQLKIKLFWKYSKNGCVKEALTPYQLKAIHGYSMNDEGIITPQNNTQPMSCQELLLNIVCYFLCKDPMSK